MIDSTIIHDTLRLVDTVRIADTVSIRDTVITKSATDYGWISGYPTWSGWDTGNLIPAIIGSLFSLGVALLVIRKQRASDVRIAEENRKHEAELSEKTAVRQAEISLRQAFAESKLRWIEKLLDDSFSIYMYDNKTSQAEYNTDEITATIRFGLVRGYIPNKQFNQIMDTLWQTLYCCGRTIIRSLQSVTPKTYESMAKAIMPN
jgi:L-lactate permease